MQACQSYSSGPVMKRLPYINWHGAMVCGCRTVTACDRHVTLHVTFGACRTACYLQCMLPLVHVTSSACYLQCMLPPVHVTSSACYLHCMLPPVHVTTSAYYLQCMLHCTSIMLFIPFNDIFRLLFAEITFIFGTTYFSVLPSIQLRSTIRNMEVVF